MNDALTIALPTADRPTTFRFYEAMGFETPGEAADDGVPEPLQVVVNQGVRIMFIPHGGFGWVTERPMAEPGVAECLLGLTVDTDDEVDTAIGRARAAGAEVVAEPARQPWGYRGTFADPDGHLREVINPA